MSPKVRNIIGWVLTAVIAILFLFGAFMNIMLSPEQKKQMVEMGLNIPDQTVRILGVLQLLCAVLFVIPRTGVLGTMLLTAYLGGAICFHVVRGDGRLLMAVVFEALVWITALIRFPEIGWRLFRGSIPS